MVKDRKETIKVGVSVNPVNEAQIIVRGLEPDELIKAMKEGYEELKGTKVYEQYERVKRTAEELSKPKYG